MNDAGTDNGNAAGVKRFVVMLFFPERVTVHRSIAASDELTAWYAAIEWMETFPIRAIRIDVSEMHEHGNEQRDDAQEGA